MIDVAKLRAARAKKKATRPYVLLPKDRKIVEAMVIGGIPHARIAAVVGISEPTLRKYFRKTLDHGMDQAAQRVVANLFRMATGKGKDAFNAAKFYLAARHGWRTVERTELTGADGGPIDVGDARTAILGRLGEDDSETGTAGEDRQTVQ